MLKEIGFHVPIYTATGWGNSHTGDCIPVWGGYCDAPWEKGTHPTAPNDNYIFTPNLNDASIGSDAGRHEGFSTVEGKFPYLTAELGGGMQCTHHRRPIATDTDLGAISTCKLGSGANLLGYYMYCGGKHPTGLYTSMNEYYSAEMTARFRAGYYCDVPELDYDFQAPVSTCGWIKPSYKELRLLSTFLRDFGDIFSPMTTYFPQDNPSDPTDMESLRYTVRRAGSYLELCLSALGESSPVADILIHPTPFVPPAEGVLPASNVACAEPDPDVSRILCERFSYEYRFPHLGKLPGKLSVSRLSPSVLDGSNDHAVSLDAPAEEPPKLRLPRFYSGEDPALGAKRGTATHEFLQFCDLRRLLDLGVDAEAERLLSGRFLSAESLSLVRRDELEVFRASPLLAEMLDAGDIRRELRFNVMLPASLFSGDPALAEALGDSEVLVQGVMDCVFISADGTLTLVDYKTDRIPKGLGADAAASFLLERHRDQLRYYAMALRKIYGRAPDRILLYSLCLGKGIQADLSLSDFSPESRSGY
jgi:hypothetical protein